MPLDPEKYPKALVERRQRVIEIVERLHTAYPQVYGHRRKGGVPE